MELGTPGVLPRQALFGNMERPAAKIEKAAMTAAQVGTESGGNVLPLFCAFIMLMNISLDFQKLLF